MVRGNTGEYKANMLPNPVVDEGRKRVIGIMAAILAARQAPSIREYEAVPALH